MPIDADEQALPLLPTSLVGSYPQPDWLIDRARLAGHPPPRIRSQELWRVAPEFLEQAQDDATLLAIREQEEAGLDILTDGEIRRESYSNRFATALEGIDLANPAMVPGRSGRLNAVPRIVGTNPPKASGRSARRAIPACAHQTAQIKITVPGPFTMTQQAQNEFYPSEEAAALDYAAAVNEEIKDLFAAGADIVQIDEPYMQSEPEKARQYGVTALNRALDGVKGTTAVHICFGYAAMVPGKPSGYAFLSELAACSAQQISVETAQPSLDCSVLAKIARQDYHPRRSRSLHQSDRDAANRRRSHPPRPAVCPAGTDDRCTRLWYEVPAARGGLRQAPVDGPGRSPGTLGNSGSGSGARVITAISLAICDMPADLRYAPG